jgi:hypothetical protein
VQGVGDDDELRSSRLLQVPDDDEPVVAPFFGRAGGLGAREAEVLREVAPVCLQLDPDVLLEVGGVGARVALVAEVLQVEPAALAENGVDDREGGVLLVAARVSGVGGALAGGGARSGCAPARVVELGLRRNLQRGAALVLEEGRFYAVQP